MTRPNHSRRRFLRGAGASLLLPPLASLARGRRAQAQMAAPRRRFLVIYIPQQETEGFLPQTAPFTLAGSYLEPLEPWKDRMLWVHNMKGRSGHMEGHSECLTGYANADWRPLGGPSLDQYVAKRLGNVTPLSSLELTGASPWDSNRDDGVLSWSDKVLPVQAIPDARRGFERVFGPNMAAPSAGALQAAQAAQAAAKRKALQKSLLDGLMEDYKRVSAPLGAGDRQLLDAHLTLLREQEQRLARIDPGPSAACGPTVTAPAADLPWRDYPTRMQHHVDTVIGAFRCDATRVASLLFGLAQETQAHPWVGNKDNFHSVAHGDVSNPKEQHFAVRKWQAGLIVKLLEGLAAIPEGNGTVLDNTTILRVSELGYYPWSADPTGRHLRNQVSALVIGNAGGYFKTGRVVDTQQTDYCNLLLTMGHALGHADLGSFGKLGTAPIAALRG